MAVIILTNTVLEKIILLFDFALEEKRGEERISLRGSSIVKGGKNRESPESQLFWTFVFSPGKKLAE